MTAERNLCHDSIRHSWLTNSTAGRLQGGNRREISAPRFCETISENERDYWWSWLCMRVPVVTSFTCPVRDSQAGTASGKRYIWSSSTTLSLDASVKTSRICSGEVALSSRCSRKERIAAASTGSSTSESYARIRSHSTRTCAAPEHELLSAGPHNNASSRISPKAQMASCILDGLGLYAPTWSTSRYPAKPNTIQLKAIRSGGRPYTWEVKVGQAHAWPAG